MKVRFALAIFAVIAGISCSGSPTDPGGVARTLTLHYGETALVAGMSLSFADVTDSRCPTTATCVWAGDAAIRLESGTDSVLLHTNGSAGAASARLAAVTVTLIDVKPEPVNPGELKKSDYVVTVRVAR